MHNIFRTLIYPSSGACDCCWITTSVILFSVRCLLEIWCGLVRVVSMLQASAFNSSRKLLMMDILMSETYWTHKKWNKIASGIKLVFHSSTIYMLNSCCFCDIYRCTMRNNWCIYNVGSVHDHLTSIYPCVHQPWFCQPLLRNVTAVVGEGRAYNIKTGCMKQIIWRWVVYLRCLFYDNVIISGADNRMMDE